MLTSPTTLARGVPAGNLIAPVTASAIRPCSLGAAHSTTIDSPAWKGLIDRLSTIMVAPQPGGDRVSGAQ